MKGYRRSDQMVSHFFNTSRRQDTAKNVLLIVCKRRSATFGNRNARTRAGFHLVNEGSTPSDLFALNGQMLLFISMLQLSIVRSNAVERTTRRVTQEA